MAGYVSRHADRVPFQSVHAVARAAGVSVASVCRMVQQAGYASFKEFKIALAQETAAPVSAVYEAVAPGDSSQAVVRKVFGGYIQSLQNTLKMLDLDDCLRAAKLISDSKWVVCFGIGGSGAVAHQAAIRLSHLDIQAEGCADSYHMLIRAAHMRKEQVAIGISHSGRSTATVEALRLAGENGATTIGISNYPRSPLRRVSSIFFCTAFEESGVKAAALSAVVVQMCLLDALYVLIARSGRTTARVDRVNQEVEKLFRIPEKKR